MGRFAFVPTLDPVNSFRRRVLNIPGGNTCTWTVPTDVKEVTFELWGGGGAGGQNYCCYCGLGVGGGGGAYSLKSIAVTPGTTYTIVAGAGGSGNFYCSPGGSQVGCRGCTSYVTGTNLTNFCAEGGCGGCWYSGCIPGNAEATGGGLAYGGDVNLAGNKAWLKSGICTWYTPKFFSAGGSSPLGGPNQMHQGNFCTPYFSGGYDGVFPGGGGTGLSKCCCDCCGCGGSGAPGLVRITY